MTRQEAFDGAFTGVYGQGRASAYATSVGGGESVCKYMTSEGQRCGIGHVFPPELYDREMEHKSVSHVIYGWVHVRQLTSPIGPDTSKIAKWFITEFDLPTNIPRHWTMAQVLELPSMAFLTALQQAHDSVSNRVPDEFLAAFSETMRDVAEMWELDNSIIDRTAGVACS